MIIRFFRAIGIEVFWNLVEFNCPKEIDFWLHLISKMTLNNSFNSISSDLSSTQQLSNIHCETDIDDCDCDSTSLSSENHPIRLEHLLDERRGFYHQCVIFRYTPKPTSTSTSSSLSSSSFPLLNSNMFHKVIEGTNILPTISSEIRIKNLSLQEECVAKSQFPHFFELNYSPFQVTQISFRSSSSHLIDHTLPLDSTKFIQIIKKQSIKKVNLNIKKLIVDSFQLKICN